MTRKKLTLKERRLKYLTHLESELKILSEWRTQIKSELLSKILYGEPPLIEDTDSYTDLTDKTLAVYYKKLEEDVEKYVNKPPRSLPATIHLEWQINQSFDQVNNLLIGIEHKIAELTKKVEEAEKSLENKEKKDE